MVGLFVLNNLHNWHTLITTNLDLITITYWPAKDWLVFSERGSEAQLWRLDLHPFDQYFPVVLYNFFQFSPFNLNHETKTNNSFILTAVLLTIIAAAKTLQATPKTRLSGICPILPADNIWNTPIDNLPVDPNSDTYI